MKYVYLEVSSKNVKSKVHLTFKNIIEMTTFLNEPKNNLELVKEIVDSCGNLRGFLTKEIVTKD